MSSVTGSLTMSVSASDVPPSSPAAKADSPATSNDVNRMRGLGSRRQRAVVLSDEEHLQENKRSSKVVSGGVTKAISSKRAAAREASSTSSSDSDSSSSSGSSSGSDSSSSSSGSSDSSDSSSDESEAPRSLRRRATLPKARAKSKLRKQTTPPPPKRPKKKQVESSNGGSSSASSGDDDEVVTSSRAGQRDKKDELIAQILCRWWYALPPWPPEDFDFAAALYARKLRAVPLDEWETADDVDAEGFTKVYPVSHYKGIYRDPSGNAVDLRPLENKPCYTSFKNKSELELWNLLCTALGNQIAEVDKSPYKNTEAQAIANMKRELENDLKAAKTKLEHAKARARYLQQRALGQNGSSLPSPSVSVLGGSPPKSSGCEA